MAESEPRALEVLRSTFLTLDQWGAALANIYRPEAGSPLAADDEDWPWMPLTQVAVMGLGAARDHLHAVRVLIEARQMFPYAQSTLIRSALIGAAQAVWVLAPERRELRTERARLVVATIYTEQGKYLASLRKLVAEPHQETELVAEHVDQRLAELTEVRAAADRRRRLVTTDMIRDAAEAAFADPGLALEVVAEWQATSGAAHGFVWPLLGRSDTRQTAPPDDRGLAEFAAGGGAESIANPYMCAFHLARRGWSLLHLRGAVV